VTGAGPAGDPTRRRIKPHLGEQFACRRLAHRPRIADVGGPAGSAVADVVGVGFAESSQGGPVVDTVISTQRPQIARAGIDLDGLDVRLLLIAALCIVDGRGSMSVSL
jgi:hypothetical protein